MKKKKMPTIEIEEKFSIPQITYTLEGLIKGKQKFQRSQIVSPMHGTHVVDRMHYVDNSGKVNVDYGYDYIRDESIFLMRSSSLDMVQNIMSLAMSISN